MVSSLEGLGADGGGSVCVCVCVLTLPSSSVFSFALITIKGIKRLFRTTVLHLIPPFPPCVLTKAIILFVRTLSFMIARCKSLSKDHFGKEGFTGGPFWPCCTPDQGSIAAHALDE